jgi:hypothetical protein
MKKEEKRQDRRGRGKKKLVAIILDEYTFVVEQGLAYFGISGAAVVLVSEVETLTDP